MDTSGSGLLLLKKVPQALLSHCIHIPLIPVQLPFLNNTIEVSIPAKIATWSETVGQRLRVTTKVKRPILSL